MAIASPAAWAEPVPAPLQIRLVVVEGCAGPDSASRCPVPQQHSDGGHLPPQVRELAPPAQDERGHSLPEPPTTYY
ncbi:hypothetical protein [Stenotrophomonas sp. C1657]|uniref:hypothetical protein n=1 Tax=Stenotrophomonas sp. C1657 TaxID=3077844 RepID=UPI00293D0923|nr:hypothetical protein [Stenotrophomonas sp. C1657]MDV3513531.1 hypothetical protein [Stenotrophomonas sp. C1657]